VSHNLSIARCAHPATEFETCAADTASRYGMSTRSTTRGTCVRARAKSSLALPTRG